MENETVTMLENLNLVDRFLFDETMENREAYEAAVSILLENETKLLDKSETEKEFRISPQLREVRLDVVSMDSGKKIYYTEMQQKNTGNLRKRSRYYQAHIDVSLLEPGSRDFNTLNDSCFILIAPFDIFGKGLCRYTFEGTCRECPGLKLGDGAIRIFINTRGKNRTDFSEEFLDFIDYVTNSSAEIASRTKSKKIKLIHKQVQKIKKSEKMGVKYMQRWEELAEARDEGLAEGRSKGLAEGRSEGLAKGRSEGEERKLIKLICKKLCKGKPMEEIAEDLEEELEEIERICKAAKDFEPDYDCDRIYARLHEKQ
ncbi:MAG: Rpn family recombination-promoting nuclease/putative transposase [Lachnospiraceae bacterium]|nr:Rpn family recombination-promoting nuclease/putative transposase [Lachnospiraceae bacterium]